MSHRTEEEEERYLRAVSKRMPVQPERLLDHLRPHGFALTYANRDEGVNMLHYLRESPGRSGLFDILIVRSDIMGDDAWIEIHQSLIPSDRCPCVKTVTDEDIDGIRLGYPDDDIPFHNQSDVKQFELRVTDSVNDLFAGLYQEEGKALYVGSASAREGVDRYLKELKPDTDLNETLKRLKTTATDDQWNRSQQYVNSELLSVLNLQNFRLIWDIAGLCQVLYWEHDTPFRGFGEVAYVAASPLEIEAHRRFHILVSRLAREPGWPIIDPLVPNRNDDDNNVLWRENQSSHTAEMFDDYLAASDRRCDCGKRLYYVTHRVSNVSPPVAEILSRCSNGHELKIKVSDDLPGT